MYFREKLEEIMENAKLSYKEKERLMDKAIPCVLNKLDISLIIEDESLKSIINKIKESGQYDRFFKLLKEKSQHLDNSPLDNINENELSMTH